MGAENALRYSGAKLKEAINAFNNVIEGSQRYAEFARTYKQTGDSQASMYASTNVTTDFRRSGSSDFTHKAGLIFAFMNAGIQGTYSWYRMSKEARFDKKAFAMKATKAAIMFAMVPLAEHLLIAAMGGDDKKAYDLMAANVKEDNYMIPKFWDSDRGNGTERFIKIPKPKGPIPAMGDAIGRSMVEAMQKEGSWEAFANYGAGDFIARKTGNLFDAINPYGSPVFAPILQIAMNRTWYGSPLENTWMVSENIAPSNRIKDTTSSAAIFLANLPGIKNQASPIQVDYFLNQSFGVLGDYVTGDAGNAVIDKLAGNQNEYRPGSSTAQFIKTRLTTDATAASDVTSAMYDMTDLLAGIVSDAGQTGKGQDPYARLNTGLTDAEKKTAVQEAKAMTKKGGALYAAKNRTSQHYKDIDVIMKGDLSDDQKTIEVRKIKLQMLIENAQAVQKAEEYLRKYVNGTPAQYKRIYNKK
jgi:hypothetical protein